MGNSVQQRLRGGRAAGHVDVDPGSGKTFTLVKEYLRLSLADPKKLNSSYKRILAVTFTNKAASEMKQRILDALDQIANQAQMPFTVTLLCSELNITTTDLKQRAGVVLSQILHHCSDFSIGTIDSFTHKIVKTFAHDLKLPVNINLEMDVEGFYDKVISTLFNQIGEDEYVSKLLKEFVLNKAEENASWDPMPWTAVKDAKSALRVVEAAGQPNGRVLVDALHAARSATTLADLAAIPAGRLAYAQICDAPAGIPATEAELIHTARCERLLPGEGGIDLAGIFDALCPADLPVSVEIPHDIRKAVLGVEAWSRQALAAARAVLAGVRGRP